MVMNLKKEWVAMMTTIRISTIIRMSTTIGICPQTPHEEAEA
jgi:hypothetical protein